jgi:hypothetical protein
MKELFYKVAEHVFSLDMGTRGNLLCDLRQYEPFVTDPTEDVVFSLEIVDMPISTEGFTDEMHQEEEGQNIIAGHLPTGEPYFEFLLGGKRSAVLICSQDYQRARLSLEEYPQFGVNNAIMVMYALATSNKRTALFHSSVVSYQGRGYMFLGHSGTGKSTHSSLWLKYIKGTELVNDDNPVVRILEDGEVRVYGSPWSGKTPCYRNVSYPVGAIVKLSQAPYNEIQRLKGIKAYAAVVPSISGKRWDRQLAEGLHETENLIAQYVPVWHLDCLPDEAAAQLCNKTCTATTLP